MIMDFLRSAILTVLISLTFVTAVENWQQKCRRGHPCGIPGPTSLKDRIAIVGGGPAGVHMAYLLKKKGFQNVKIFESDSRVGGKSFTIHHRGTPHEMGTVYLAPDYEANIVALAKEFKVGKLINLQQATVWTSKSQPMTFHVYIVRESMKFLKTRNVTLVFKKLAEAISRYVRLHVKLFGSYDGELMPEPSRKTLYFIRGSFTDYLKRNGLYILKPLLVATQTIQGYGQLDDVSAFYGLLWNTPKMMRAISRRMRGAKEVGLYMLSSGFQPLWEKIIDRLDLNVSYESTVVRVDRWHNPWSSGVEITYKKAISPLESFYVGEYFDFVMWTPELKLSLNKIGATNIERRLFEKTEPMYFSTTLMDSTNVPRGTTVVDYWYHNILGKGDHAVWAQRDSYAALNEIYGLKYQNNSLPNGLDGGKKRSTIVYQMGSYRPTEEKLRNILRSHFRKFGGSITPLRTRIWRYFPRFGQESIRKRVPWKILNMQGYYKMWYLGSSVSFESVKSVAEYNKLLVDIMSCPSK